MAEQVLYKLLHKDATILSDDNKNNSEAFLNAIKDGDLESVNRLIGVVTDMNKIKFKGESLVSIAAFSGHSRIVKLLVRKGADNEGIDVDGLTPLHVACRMGHLEIAQFLVHRGGNINRQTFDGMTPLAMATEQGHVEVLKYLISKGVEIERSNKKGWPPLILACARGLLPTANYLLHVGADVNGADKDGWTALHFSIHYDRLDVIKSLVSAGADLDLPDKEGTTPLYVACSYGRVEILRYLLSKGADLQKANFDGETPLHAACAKGHIDVVNFILSQKESGELVNRSDVRGEIPLHVATSKGFTSIIDILVSQGGDLNAQMNKGQNWLHLNAAKPCDGSTDVEVSEGLSKLMAENSEDALGPAQAQMKCLIKKGVDLDKTENNPLEYLSSERAHSLVSQEPAESHVLEGRQLGGASAVDYVDAREDSKVDSKAHPGKEALNLSSSPTSQEVLHNLAEKIPNDKVMTLGLKLKLDQAQIARFESTNNTGIINSNGTRAMLFDWFNATEGAGAFTTLRKALMRSGLTRLAEKYLHHYI